MNTNTPTLEEKDLSDLKSEAESLGIDFAKNIGIESLSKRIAGFKKEKKKSKAATPKKLSNKAINKLKATSLSKVHIVNMDRENASATTVFSAVHNMELDLARVVPLNMDIALEEALIRDIESRKMLIPEAIMDDRGKPTGNFRMVEAKAFSVSRM